MLGSCLWLLCCFVPPAVSTSCQCASDIKRAIRVHADTVVSFVQTRYESYQDSSLLLVLMAP
jgi:hypothetical protein